MEQVLTGLLGLWFVASDIAVWVLAWRLRRLRRYDTGGGVVFLEGRVDRVPESS